MAPAHKCYPNHYCDLQAPGGKHLVLVLLSPLLPLIDHGHFQISNSLMASLSMLTLYLATSTKSFPSPPPPSSSSATPRDYVPLSKVFACVSFVCALCVKQMALYYAPVVFFYLLGWAMSPSKASSKFLRLATLGLPVIATASIIFLPFISNGQLLLVFNRMFPVSRGAYESKVGSLWCMLDVKPFDITKRVGGGTLPLVALLATCAGISPSCAYAFRAGVDEKAAGGAVSLRKMLFAAAACASTFFLTSYHVHEKTILLPLIPIQLLGGGDGRHATFAAIFSVLSAWTCSFLMELDGLKTEFWGLLLLYGAACASTTVDRKITATVVSGRLHKLVEWATRRLFPLLLIACGGVEIAKIFVPVPVKALPDLYELAVAAVAFVSVGWAWIWLHFNRP